MLHAAEGHERGHGAVGVDVDRARAERLRHADGAADILRPDARREAVDHVVADLDRVRLVLELDHGEDGAEDLLLRDAHVVAHVLEDRRLHELAARQPLAGGRAAAHDERRSFRFRDIDVVEDLLVLLRRRHRPDIGVRQHRVADLRRLRERQQAVEELVLHRALDEEARARETGLACRREDAGDRTRRRHLHVRVREDDVRRLAP